MRISDWSSDVCSSDLSRGFGARETSLFDLAQDAGTPRQFRAGDRHHRLSHPYPDRCRLLCRAGADPPQMENGPRALQGLYLDAEAQRLQVAAHDNHTPAEYADRTPYTKTRLAPTHK